MKFLLASVILAAVGVMAIPNPSEVCTKNCRIDKPVCPPGEEASGFEGCWGCCEPKVEERTVCTAVCRPVKPTCPVGQGPSGSEGCWGCCRPIPPILPQPTQRPCLAVCVVEKPECPAGEAPTGLPGCWGCCQPIGSF